MDHLQGNSLQDKLDRLYAHLKKLAESNYSISKTMPEHSCEREIAKARAQALDLAAVLAEFYIEKGGKNFRKEGA
jgi:hypothetical protein